MYTAILTVHLLLCVGLISVVLVQQGKGADLGASLGGGSSNTMFGASGGADFMTKLTTALMISFMVTSILLVKYSADAPRAIRVDTDPITGSVMEQVVVEEEATAAGTIVDTETVEVETVTEDAAGNVKVEAEAVTVDKVTEEAAPAAKAVEEKTKE